MLPTAVIALLAYGHVLSAMGWLGGGILTTFVLGPSLRQMQPASALEFNAKVLPKIVKFVQIMVGLTFLFGILLYYAYFGDFSLLSSTSQGRILALGIVLALATGAVAWGLTIPSFNKVSKISKTVIQGPPGPPPPELMKYGMRARKGATVGIVLLLVVLLTMVSAGFGLY